jgi:hypothetical protein
MAANPFQPIIDVVVKAVGDLISVPFFSFLWSWVKRMIPLFAVFLILLSIGLSAYTFFRQQQDRQLKFFVTAGGGSGADQVDLIQKKIGSEWSFWGPNYLVTEFQTGGSLDNLRNVKRDQEGNAIGVAIEGLCVDKSDLNTLVPLQWCYLHFVCRSETLQNLGISHPNSQTDTGSAVAPVTLSAWAEAYLNKKKVQDELDKAEAIGSKHGEPPSGPLQIAEMLAKGTSISTTLLDPNWFATEKTSAKEEKPYAWPIRIYLGQPNSGTRQLAELVLKNVGITPSWVEPNTYITDADQISEHLSRGNIDGAFILEPLGTPLITSLTNKKIPCSLISIESEDIEDLRDSNPYLVPTSIPAYTYEFSFPQDDTSKIGSTNHRDLHLAKVATIATRRILVTSAKMRDTDAYHLANAVRVALPGDDVSRHTDAGYWPAPNESDSSRNLNYALHPGVVWNMKSEPGFNWFNRNTSWLVPLLLAMTVSLVTEIKNRISKRLADVPPATPDAEELKPQPVNSGSSTAANEINAQIDTLLHNIHEAGDSERDSARPTSTEIVHGWETEIGTLYRRVHTDYRAGNLARELRGDLYVRLLQLRSELEVLKSHPWGMASEKSGRGRKARTK